MSIPRPTSSLAHLPTAAEVFAPSLAGWHRIAVNPPPDLHTWATQNLAELRRLADSARLQLAGASLVHGDIRADNLLIRADLDPTFGEQLFHVAVGQAEAQVPAHRRHDHLGREPEPGERRARR